MALRTFLVTLLIFKSLIVTSGCAVTSTTGSEEGVKSPISRVYSANYEEVWRATQKSLARYPIQLNNVDQGKIDTEIIKPNQKVWQNPFKELPRYPNARYALKLKVMRGKLNNKDATRVSVHKLVFLEEDFFSGSKQLPSDGFEENAIIYRIEREIRLERSMKRAFEQAN